MGFDSRAVALDLGKSSILNCPEEISGCGLDPGMSSFLNCPEDWMVNVVDVDAVAVVCCTLRFRLLCLGKGGFAPALFSATGMFFAPVACALAHSLPECRFWVAPCASPQRVQWMALWAAPFCTNVANNVVRNVLPKSWQTPNWQVHLCFTMHLMCPNLC